MAEVCEHCQGPVSRKEEVIVRDGYSYHMKCLKCCKFHHVCSERDLQNAEVFKGVIFCNSCARRIFQGCSTARRTKDPSRFSTGRRRPRPQRRRNSIDGIIELSTLAVSTESSDQRNSCKAKSSMSSKNVKPVSPERHLKQSSVEMGVTTEVTQELLMQMQCPVINERKHTPYEKPRKIRRKRSKKTECSDLRIAELGASTEIANMALHYKSELPVIIKSETRIIELASKSKSAKKSLSESGGQEATTDSAYSSEDSSNNRTWMDRTLGSLLRMPYRVFVKKVLQRSSLISVIISSEKSHGDLRLFERFKGVFHNEVSEHQKRGVKRLYSTINRKKKPNKLGWLVISRSQVNSSYVPFDFDVNADCTKTKLRSKHQAHKRCKHFNNSHSYRCMRTQAMRLAGPTKSELAGFRTKMMDIVSPGFFRRKLSPMLMSQACGNSVKS